MTKFYKVVFTHTETVTTEATTEGTSVDDVADKIRNYFADKVDSLVINEITELETAPVTPEGKPSLRVVN
jgi:hypothetical protein